jgi:hypothetical protein
LRPAAFFCAVVPPCDELLRRAALPGSTGTTPAFRLRRPVFDERERMSWNDLGDGTRSLAEQIVDDGFEPDIVLGIARGGLLVAGAIAYALGVKNTFTMNVEFYTGVDERLELPMILPPVPAASRS